MKRLRARPPEIVIWSEETREQENAVFIRLRNHLGRVQLVGVHADGSYRSQSVILTLSMDGIRRAPGINPDSGLPLTPPLRKQ